MSLRTKVVLALAVLAVVATVAIGASTYVTTDRQLNRAIDRSLDDAAGRVSGRPGGDNDGPRGFPRGGPPTDLFEQVLVQRIDTSGAVLVGGLSHTIPVGEADAAAAGNSGTRVRHDATIDGEPYRVLTVGTAGGALQFARSTAENATTLRAIRNNTLLAVAIVGVAAALLGWLLARQITRRLVRLAEAASSVAASGRLDVDVPVEGQDEAADLGRAFKGMLDALDGSRQQQQQLVQDAGHELRTPLTSLRTNVAVMRRFEQLSPENRAQLLEDLDSETRELSALVDEIVELATERRDSEPVEHRSLGEIAERAAERSRRRSGATVSVDADETEIDLRPVAIERAIQNLIDNAAKFAPGAPIEVTVRGGSVSVRDHGPGIADADRAHVFDRFYRSVQSRSQPGSGLGLAIVKSIVELHGGTVSATNAPDGGAVVGFTLPA